MLAFNSSPQASGSHSARLNKFVLQPFDKVKQALSSVLKASGSDSSDDRATLLAFYGFLEEVDVDIETFDGIKAWYEQRQHDKTVPIDIIYALMIVQDGDQGACSVQGYLTWFVTKHMRALLLRSAELSYDPKGYRRAATNITVCGKAVDVWEFWQMFIDNLNQDIKDPLKD